MRPCPTPSDAFGTARQSGIGIDTLVLPVLLRFVTCTDGSFDEILSTMVHVVAISEGAFICTRTVLEVAWADALLGQHVRVEIAPASTWQLLPWR